MILLSIWGYDRQPTGEELQWSDNRASRFPFARKVCISKTPGVLGGQWEYESFDYWVSVILDRCGIDFSENDHMAADWIRFVYMTEWTSVLYADIDVIFSRPPPVLGPNPIVYQNPAWSCCIWSGGGCLDWVRFLIECRKKAKGRPKFMLSVSRFLPAARGQWDQSLVIHKPKLKRAVQNGCKV
jgi:hypothetical protein